MSIITGMGGNAGTQTISIIIRNIAMGKVSLKDSWHLLGKEILLGVIDGAVIGIVTSGIVSIMCGNYCFFSNGRKFDNFRCVWNIDSINFTKIKN